MRDCHKCINEEHCFYPYDVDSCPNYLERVTVPKIEHPDIEKLTKMPEIDLEGYQSPIEIIYDKLTADFNIQLENNVMTAVQNYGINVDRDELIKALNYDRRQYEAGYRTAMLRYKAQKGEWLQHNSIEEDLNIWHCSNCKMEYCSECGGRPLEYNYNFCPNCGADMRP